MCQVLRSLFSCREASFLVALSLLYIPKERENNNIYAHKRQSSFLVVDGVQIRTGYICNSMGQRVSSDVGTNADVPDDFTKMRLMNAFDKRTVEQFTPPELMAFKDKLGAKSLLDSLSTDDVRSLMPLIFIPPTNLTLQDIATNILTNLSKFPLLSDSDDNISGVGLLKSIALLSTERYKKFTTNPDYNRIALLFIAICPDNGYKKDVAPDDAIDVSSMLSTFDSIPLERLTIPASHLLQLVIWMQILSIHCPTKNCQIHLDTIIKEWDTYTDSAMNIMRSIDCNIISTLTNHTVNYQQFYDAINALMPNFMNPLSTVLEHLLFSNSDMVKHPDANIQFQHSNIMKSPLIAQLSASLSQEVVLPKLQRLYVGRESGFSMRSLQAKVFKWMAPTILLVSGKRIVNDTEYMTSKNTRYRNFLNEFPKLRDEEQHLDPCLIHKRKVTFAVYTDEPWKVTNKAFFGGTTSTIVQISPRQDVFKAKQSELIYFNTVGGGIGIGNQQPKIKPSSKTYVPGNVSLTLDNNLEFAVFRHVGYGGKFAPSLLLTKQQREEEPFELRFIIQDVEVWGCGGEKELEEQLREWKWEEAEAKRKQQINLQSLGEDRALLEMAGLVGQHQSGGSI